MPEPCDHHLLSPKKKNLYQVDKNLVRGPQGQTRIPNVHGIYAWWIAEDSIPFDPGGPPPPNNRRYKYLRHLENHEHYLLAYIGSGKLLSRFRSHLGFRGSFFNTLSQVLWARQIRPLILCNHSRNGSQIRPPTQAHDSNQCLQRWMNRYLLFNIVRGLTHDGGQAYTKEDYKNIESDLVMYWTPMFNDTYVPDEYCAHLKRLKLKAKEQFQLAPNNNVRS